MEYKTSEEEILNKTNVNGRGITNGYTLGVNGQICL